MFMEKITSRDAFFNRLYEIAKNDRNVILVSADMGAPSLDKFRKDLSSQYINTGIAEQSMVTVAVGLALSGKKVYTYAIMPFVTLRCYEAIKINISLMNVPVTTVGVGSGFSYEDSGPTHHTTEDIAAMRLFPNMTILNTSDAVIASKMADISYKLPGPSYVRLDREVLPAIYKKDEDFSDGLKMLKSGKDVQIITTGNMVYKALEISKKLAKSSIDAGVIDLYQIKPVNVELLLKCLKQTKRVVTLEENLLAGGVGSVVTEILADNGKNLLVKRFGVPDKYYYAYGGRENIRSLCGLDEGTIIKEILKWMK